MDQQYFHHITETNSIAEKSKVTEKNSDRTRLIKSVNHGSVTFLITLKKPIRPKN